MSLRALSHVVACSLFALLSACGGGGGGAAAAPALQSPPASAAALSPSPSEASLGVQAAVAVGAEIAEQDAGAGSAFLPFGDPFAAQWNASTWLGRSIAAANRERPMALTTLACTDLFPPPCSGSLSLDTNIAGAAGSVAAGSYIAFDFAALQGSFEGESFSVSGALRIDYLTAFDPAATSFANTGFLLTTGNLSVGGDGATFGPKNNVTLIEFDALGAATLTVDGLSFSGLAGISFTDADNFSIGAATVRRAHWSQGNAHVTSTFEDWNVGAGRPLAGSSVTIRGAGGGSLAIAVTASSSSTVVYDALLTIGGVLTRYTVTATYPIGGAATYVAVDVPV